MLSEKDRQKVDELVEKYRDDPGPLISILQEIQDIFGYLPEDILSHLSRKLRISESKTWGIVTFYSQFYLEPRGEHTIRVCMGTACHVRGAKRVLERLQKVLEVETGGTTKDLKFSLETVRCLGTCFLAPVMMIDEDYFGKLTIDRVEKILDKFRKA